MHLAVSFGGYYASVRKYVEASKRSESCGLHSVWLADSQMIHRDVYQCLALFAANTKRVKLGTAVTNPITRDLTVTAGSISTLDEISEGRAILGIGPGDSSVRRIGSRPATVSQLEYAVNKIRSTCKGEESVSISGEKISMRWSNHNVPIFVSATGPKMLELAGVVGDGVIINVGTGKSAMEHALSSVRRGQERRKGKETFSVADLSFVSLSEDRNLAIQAARPYVVWYLKNARHLFELNGIDPKPLESFDVGSRYVEHDHIHTDNWSSATDRSKFVTDEMVDKFAIAGTPDDCVRKLKEKERLGVDIFIARHTGEEEEWESFLDSYLQNVGPEFT